MEQIKNRLASLRKAMKKAGISACIIPGTDPHASEYIADYWKEREWISGFDGSAGIAVVTTKLLIGTNKVFIVPNTLFIRTIIPFIGTNRLILGTNKPLIVPIKPFIGTIMTFLGTNKTFISTVSILIVLSKLLIRSSRTLIVTNTSVIGSIRLLIGRVMNLCNQKLLSLYKDKLGP